MNKRNLAEQSVVLRQFGALIGAGLTFHESAQVLVKESRSKRDIRLFTELANEVSSGGVASEVFKSWGWNKMAVTLVRVGEMSGSLATACSTAAHELAYRVALKKKVVGMMLYPACVFGCAACLVVGIVGFVFPKILPVLQSIDGALPLSTRIVLWSTHMVRHHGVVLVVGAGATLGAAWGAWKKLAAVRWWMSVFVLKSPFVGHMLKAYTVAHICRTLSVLSSAHLDVVDCIDHVREAVVSPVYRHALAAAREHVIQGDTLSRSLGMFPALFPTTVTSMVAVAEQSGSLAEMAGSLSDMYESEYTASLERVSKLVEPLLMIGLGLVVGFIAVSIITPIYEITTHVQR